MKKWWFTILMWIMASIVYGALLYCLNSNDDMIIIGGCVCGFILLGVIFMILGILNVPQQEENRYKMYEDFLKWYENKYKEKNEQQTDIINKKGKK